MTTARRSVLLTAVIVISVVAGGAAMTGQTAALSASSSAPFPRSPGTTADSFSVSVEIEQSDAISKNGMRSMTLDFGTGGSGASVRNVTQTGVSTYVSGTSGIRQAGPIDVSKAGNGRVEIRFQQPVRVQAGDRVIVDVANVGLPSSAGEYDVGVSATATTGGTDGPVPVGYEVVATDLTFPNQSASQFSGNQTVNVTGVVPNDGYVAVFTMGKNGSRGKLVGNSRAIPASFEERNYSVNLNGNVERSQRLMAVAYYETNGNTRATRLNGSFNQNQDTVVTNDGVPANATGRITTLDVNGKVTAGNQYDQGERLLFAGDPATSYRVNTVANGSAGRVVSQFETAPNGSATIDTGDLGEGQYVLTRIDNGSVVGLDNDSTTSVQDDSFFVTGQQATQNTTTGATSGGASGSGDDATATPTGAGGGSNGENGGANATGNNSGGGGANASGDGSENGGSGAFGPGFGIAIAVVALLGAALLAVRRTR